MDEKSTGEHRQGRKTGWSDPWMSKEKRSSRQLGTLRAVQRLESCRDEASLGVLGIRWRVPVEQSLSQGVVSEQKSRKVGGSSQAYPKTLLHAKGSLYFDRVRVVVRDEAAIPAHTVSCNCSLVNLLLGTLSGEMFVLKRAIVPANASMLMTRSRDVKEAASKERNSKQDLLAGHPRGHQVPHARVARWLVLAHRVQLGMVATLVRPLAEEVVGYEVDRVKILGRLSQVDVLQDRFHSREGDSEQVAVFRKMDANRCDQGEEVVSLLWGAGVFPNN